MSAFCFDICLHSHFLLFHLCLHAGVLFNTLLLFYRWRKRYQACKREVGRMSPHFRRRLRHAHPHARIRTRLGEGGRCILRVGGEGFRILLFLFNWLVVGSQ